MKSLIQTEKECYITQSTNNLHKHHVFPGAFRTKSEKWGMWVWLRSDWHVGEPYSIHSDENLLIELKKQAQIIFEEKYSHEKYMEIFKRNYL